MLGRGQCVEVHSAHTVAYLLRCPRSLVLEAMRVCKFSLEESGNPAKQMALRRSFSKATGGKLVPPSQCYQCVDSYDDNSVAADQSNLCSQRTSINDDDAEDAEDVAEDGNNFQRYVDNAAKAKAEADKEVGGGDAEVLY
jgi:hypothetical protein